MNTFRPHQTPRAVFTGQNFPSEYQQTGAQSAVAPRSSSNEPNTQPGTAFSPIHKSSVAMLQFSQSFHQNMNGHPHNHFAQHLNTAPNQSYNGLFNSVDGGSVDSNQVGGTGTLLEQVKK